MVPLKVPFFTTEDTEKRHYFKLLASGFVMVEFNVFLHSSICKNKRKPKGKK